MSSYLELTVHVLGDSDPRPVRARIQCRNDIVYVYAGPTRVYEVTFTQMQAQASQPDAVHWVTVPLWDAFGQTTVAFPGQEIRNYLKGVVDQAVASFARELSGHTQAA
jgi:hypothetical protein